MSKKRSIAKKLNLKADFPLPEPLQVLPNNLRYSNNIQDKYFGEKVKLDTGNSSSTSKTPDTSDLLLFVGDSCDVLFSKSSASSTSDSEDIEYEATNQISTEFEKIEGILYGETKCSTELESEYKQWTKNFPHLRVLGKSMKIHPSVHEPEDYYEEIIAEHYDTNDLETTLDAGQNIKEQIKETVINNVLKEVKSKLLNKSQKSSNSLKTSETRLPKRERKVKECSKESNNNNLPVKNDNLLQVSSIFLQNSPLRRTNTEFQSPIVKSHLSASKWQREESTSDYSSLPYISQSTVPYNGNRRHEPLSANKSERNVNQSSADSRKKSGTSVAKAHSKYTYSPRVKNVVLPPIQNLGIDGDFRSVSSTPRKFHNRPISNKYKK